MRDYINKHRFDFGVVFLFVVGAILSFVWPWNPGIDAVHNFGGFFAEMISFIPAIFILIGLLDVWVPKDVVAKHTGRDSGWKSAMWMIALAMLQAGPLYGAFPVAYLMWKKGTSVRNIFIYLGAFSTLKLPMLGFEIGFLGLKFTLLRTILSVPIFILIAFLMDKIFGKNFSMGDGSKDHQGESPTSSKPSL